MPPSAAVDDTDAYDVPSGGSLKLKGCTPKSKSSSHRHHKKRSHSSRRDDNKDRKHHDDQHRSYHRHQHRHPAQVDDSASTMTLHRLGKEQQEGGGGDQKVERSDSTDANADPVSSGAQGEVRKRRTLTKSQAKFEEARQKRLGQHIAQEANLSHKDRVEAFNNHLASLTEHFDMPKVCLTFFLVRRLSLPSCVFQLNHHVLV